MNDRHAPTGKIFWSCLVVGWSMMAFGLLGILEDADRTRPANFATWFVGSALAHDLLLAPAVFLVALALGRIVPSRVRPIIQGGLIVAGCVIIVALPFVLGRGGEAGNTSALPRNYPAGLAIVLSGIAAVTCLITWRRIRA